MSEPTRRAVVRWQTCSCGVDWNVVEKHHTLRVRWVLGELVAFRHERERQELLTRGLTIDAFALHLGPWR